MASRCIRAPQGAQDALSKEQVGRYLALLGQRDASAVAAQAFEDQAQRSFDAAGGTALRGEQLASAVQGALQGMEHWRATLHDEFADQKALAHVLAAFEESTGQRQSIDREHFATFVRFCLAYRIHCYFETSRLPPGPEVIFVLGGPGAGKGTQCARISATFGHKHLSVGDLLREERQRPGSQHAELIETCIRDGKLVPVEISVGLLLQAMERHGWQEGKFLIDGFPWSFEHWAGWNKAVGTRARVKWCLYFECGEATMEARILERGKTSGRTDDNLESIRRRLRIFRQDAMPVVNSFDQQGLVRRVNAEQSMDAVWLEVQQLFGPSVVFVLGGPGAGKGTQCARISETYGYKHLSAGDLLRAERQRPGSQYGALIESYIKDGKLVPVEITVKLLLQAMEQSGWAGGKYLVDGFPRSFDNLEGWEKIIGDKARVQFCLFFDCGEATMEARILERGKTSGRADDNLESMKKRFATFRQESMPVVEALDKKGIMRRVNAEHTQEEVWADVQQLFGPSVVFVLGGPGAGKGTQCARISETYGYRHLSAGDLLRAERQRPGSQYGELIESYIREGKLVPVEITVKLIQQAMEQLGWAGGKYLIDGFPRSFNNLEGWDRVIGSKARVQFCLFFECGEATMEARIMERGKTSGRADDNLESMRKRFNTFRSESMPVVEALEQKGLVRRVNAEHSTEEVWGDVQGLFGPSVVFVLGGPGAGKGTQCARISETYGYHHLSAGDLLRAERQRPGSQYGELIESYIREGKLVPVEITVKLIQQAMEQRGWAGGKYLIDGFPRSFDNLEGWQKIIGAKARVQFCLFFECSEATMEARILERGKTSGRADDNLESMRKRFATFRQESMPVVASLEQEGIMRKISAEKGPEDVWKDVQRLFGPSVVFVLGGPGAGKGTQCARISQSFGYHHLSAGDLLRAERQRPGSKYGELIESYIKEGKLVPVEITVKLILQAMEQLGWAGGKYLVDGFPRSFDNLEGWERIIGAEARVDFCLFFECSEAVMEARILERGKTSGRADDNLESMRKRFATFRQESLPVAEALERKGLVRRVDAGRDLEVVWADVQKLFRH